MKHEPQKQCMASGCTLHSGPFEKSGLTSLPSDILYTLTGITFQPLTKHSRNKMHVAKNLLQFKNEGP